MLLVGLTGGIGSGKSTVASMLSERGAVVVDADDLARDALSPGTDGERRALERFPGAAGPDGHVDRALLASIVFADASARADLEAIVHPEVRRRFAETVAGEVGGDRVVVFVAPLLVETGSATDFPVLIVVEAPEAVRVERLASSRGMSPEDARSRIRAQASDEERRAAADVVLVNDGAPEGLEEQVDDLWADLLERASA